MPLTLYICTSNLQCAHIPPTPLWTTVAT